jgi:apolipoprotein N-acyltransferase
MQKIISPSQLFMRRLVLLLLLVAVIADKDEWDAQDLGEIALALWNISEALASFWIYAQQVGAWTALLQAAVAFVVFFGVYQAFRPQLEAFATKKEYQPYRMAWHAASAVSQSSTRKKN